MFSQLYFPKLSFPPPLPSGYGSSCDCFGGIVGALAGFAALAGLVAFAIAQANAGGGRRRRSLSEPEELALHLSPDVIGETGCDVIGVML